MKNKTDKQGVEEALRELIENWYYQAGDDVLASSLADQAVELLSLHGQREYERGRMLYKLMGATEFLRSQGVEDEDTFTAEDVQDLLDTFINQSLTTPSKEGSE